MGKRAIGIPLGTEIDAATVDSLEILKKDLGALGVRLTIAGALPGDTLLFEYDDEAHKRNAGRKRKIVPPDSGLADMTQEQMDEWLLGTPVADIQETLGIGRATAYRRVNEARLRIEYAAVSLDCIDGLQR